ncbi:MAG: DUF58 domain-containing protein [bacterium]
MAAPSVQIPAPPSRTPGKVVLDEAFLARLERLQYLVRLVVLGGMRGEKKSKRYGSSIEFADYRQYSMGDDLRRLDWKVWARTDRFYTKLFHEEEDLTVHLLLDCSASMGSGSPETKFHYAQQVTAALGYIALANMERVRLRVFADRLYADDTGYMRSKSSIYRAFRFLEDLAVAPRTTTDFRRSLEAFAVQSKTRGLVVVVSDFLAQEGIFEGIKRILYHGHQVCCIQILDQAELEPDVRGELKLIDAETGLEREVTISPKLLKLYRAYRDAHLEMLESTCRRLGVSYVRATTQDALEETVIRGLQTARIVRRG